MVVDAGREANGNRLAFDHVEGVISPRRIVRELAGLAGGGTERGLVGCGAAKTGRKMSRFTTRVELHKANEEDYKTLHEAMRAEGFSRLIGDREGKKYRLPTAEYNRDAELTKQQVLNSAKRAAAKTSRSASIIVTESNGRVWANLKEV